MPLRAFYKIFLRGIGWKVSAAKKIVTAFTPFAFINIVHVFKSGDFKTFN